MSEVLIRVRDNGPLVITGKIKVVDAVGVEIPLPAGKESISFCGCGHAKNKPFCDGSHKTLVPPPSNVPVSPVTG